CEQAGVEDLHIHDLRGRAGVDKREAEGMEAAKDLLGHDQMATTAHYVEGKTVRKVRPTK
ncbi:MAG TPA: integrase, partial [Burkholderiaceae bacterium]|nr:integrase [Burkholderiaceae bacterium]